MASDLHMVQLDLDVGSLMRVAQAKGWRTRNRQWDDLGYLIHHQLAAVFQDLAPQPFRALEQHGQWVTVIGYSRADADELRTRADEFGRPAERGACRLDELRTKPMPSSLFQDGRRLGFDLRACPIVRLANKAESVSEEGRRFEFQAGTELDAFLHRRCIKEQKEDRETVYREWLRQRIDGKAKLLDAWLHSFRRVRLLRRGKRSGAGDREVTVPERPDALLTGTVEVTDSDGFRDLLSRGVGRHRAFGFGMLLLRPPD